MSSRKVSLRRKIFYIACENCGRDIQCSAGMWECQFCGHDNTRGHVRGKWFQIYSSERSAGKSKEEARKMADDSAARCD